MFKVNNGKFLGRNVNYSTEIIAGITTFLTMAYIIFVNPDILSSAGMDRASLIVVTCLVTGVITIMVGLFSNSPIAMAPGMGLNAFFAFSLVLNENIRWEQALGIVFISGLFFLLLSLVGLRKKILKAIPSELLNSIAVGIGVFIAFMGLQNLGIIVKSDATMVSAGKISGSILIGLSALLLMIILEIIKIRGALLVGIAFATIVSLITGDVSFPDKLVSLNIDISPVFGKLDILGALKISFIAPIFTLMFMDLFDSMGSLLGLAREADMIDEKGEIPGLGKLLSLDAAATMFGSVFGTSTTTTYVESASGISAGGRSGLTSVVTGSLFLIFILFVPVIMIVPKIATAPALIMVGFYMIKNIVKIDFTDIETGFPSFIIIIMIAFSYSISHGLAFGFITFTILKIFKGKTREIKPVLWMINIMSLIYFIA
ncbi:MAG: NCS2 family permease [Candidatus Aminicenantes bacterium]|nr:NCS2 family permease [Candidatus Aminicenantes bacterium]